VRFSQRLQKNTNSPYFGGLMSVKVIDVHATKNLLRVLVMMSSMSIPICNRLHAIRANIII